MDDELALKIAERMWNTREKLFPPKTRIPFSYRQTDDMIDMARAALQVVKDAGWKPPSKSADDIFLELRDHGLTDSKQSASGYRVK